jgi:hypothetical protein
MSKSKKKNQLSQISEESKPQKKRIQRTKILHHHQKTQLIQLIKKL